jgi:hypothetical protein
MSRQDIVDSYLNGEISRRTLVRRLVGAGVALSAAAAYAELLRPEWAHASHAECFFVPHYGGGGHYECHYPTHYETGTGTSSSQGTQGTQGTQGGSGGQVTTGNQVVSDTTAPNGRFGKLGTISLSSLLLTGRFFVRFTTNEAGQVVVVAYLIVPGAETNAAGRIAVARGRAVFRKAGTKRILVKVSKGGRRTLKRARRRRRRYKFQVVATAKDRAGNSRKRRLNLRLR